MHSYRFISLLLAGLLALLLACSSPVEQVELTKQKSGETLYVDHQEKLNISWAPDSSKIAYQTPRATLILLQYSLSGEMTDSLGVLTVPYWNGEVSSIEISPNSEHVVYQASDTRFRLISLTDTHTKTYSFPEFEFLTSLKWSSDGDNLYAAVRRDGDHFLLTVDLATGATHSVLLDSLDHYYGAQLFKNNQILYTGYTHRGDPALWYKKANSHATRIASNLASEMTLFENEGVIVFSYNDESNKTVITKYSIADSITTVLNGEFESVRLLKQVADLQQIYFLGRHATLGSRLFSMSLTGEWQPLSDWFPPYFFQWSNDGQSIIRQEVSQKIYSAVHVYDLLTQSVSDLTPGSIFSLNETPVFTANSQQVIFSQNGRLVSTPAISGDISPLAPAGSPLLYNPEVSPDGSLIVCDDGKDIYILPVDGGELVKTSNSLSMSLSHPTWSPDGQKIACQTDETLEILNFDGRQITEDKTYFGRFRFIKWARKGVPPFGAQILYRKDLYGIATINPETGERFESFVFSADLHSFCWAPNGQEIAYSTPFEVVRSPLFTSLIR